MITKARKKEQNQGVAIIEVAIVVLVVFGIILGGLFVSHAVRTNACISDASNEIIQKIKSDPSFSTTFNKDASTNSTEWQTALDQLQTYFLRTGGLVDKCGLKNDRFMGVKYVLVGSSGAEVELPGTYSYALILPGQKIKVEEVDTSGGAIWTTYQHPEKPASARIGTSQETLNTLYPVRASAFRKADAWSGVYGVFHKRQAQPESMSSGYQFAKATFVTRTPTPIGWTPPPATASPLPSATAPGGPSNTPGGPGSPVPDTPTPDPTQNAQRTGTAKAQQTMEAQETIDAGATQTAAPTATPPTGPTSTPVDCSFVMPACAEAQPPCGPGEIIQYADPCAGLGVPNPMPPGCPCDTAPFCAYGRATSCFDPATLILMGDKTTKRAIDVVKGDKLWNPVTMSEVTVERVVAGPEEYQMIEIKMHGKTIKVTQWHPFLSDNGIKAAKNLTIYDKLMDADDHRYYPIDSITLLPLKPGQMVVNFGVKDSKRIRDRLIVGGGFVTGDRDIQDELIMQGDNLKLGKPLHAEDKF